MTASKHSVPPVITAPVSRTLLVRDIKISLAFYNDILGFQADATEAVLQGVTLVNGPAQIVLEQVRSTHPTAGLRNRPGEIPVSNQHEKVNSPQERQSANDSNASQETPPANQQEGHSYPQPPLFSSARNEAAPPPSLVYFEVNDVWAMHAAITARGGQASVPERVNWIKVELFSVLDPDGHVLWFGKSYHEFYEQVHTEAGVGQLRKIMPEMPLTNVTAGIAYYHDVLGFSVNYAQDDLGVMDRDSVRLLLVQRTPAHTGIGSCFFYMRDADALYRELLDKGASIPAPPVSHPWGLRDFTVIDPEGNRLCFAQTFE